MIWKMTDSASGDLAKVCRGKDPAWPVCFDSVLRKGFWSTVVMSLGGGGGNSWNCAMMLDLGLEREADGYSPARLEEAFRDGAIDERRFLGGVIKADRKDHTTVSQ